MNTTQNPHDAVKAVLDNPVLPDGDDERFAGFGVMGLPFESGHYLALRQFPDGIVRAGVSVGVAPRSGRQLDVLRHHARRAELRSLLQFGDRQRRRPVRYRRRVDHPMVVPGDDSRTARTGRSTWQSTFASRMLTTVASRLPEWAWTNQIMLGVIGRVAGVTLGAGDVRLAGAAPNGQQFMVAPRQIWEVSASRAVLGGEDLGPIGQAHGAGTAGRLPPATEGHLRDRHGPFRELRRDRAYPCR